jgi:hypothetical protein
MATPPEVGMPVPASSSHDTLTAIAVLVVIFAWICVIYWRVVLQVLIVALLGLALFSVVVSVMGAIYLIHHL